MVRSLNSTAFGTMTDARTRFCRWSEEPRKCAGLGGPSPDRIADRDERSINIRIAGGAEVAGSSLETQRRVAHGLLRRPERRQVLCRAPGDEARAAITEAADIDRQGADEAAGQASQELHREPGEPRAAGPVEGRSMGSARGLAAPPWRRTADDRAKRRCRRSGRLQARLLSGGIGPGAAAATPVPGARDRRLHHGAPQDRPCSPEIQSQEQRAPPRGAGRAGPSAWGRLGDSIGADLLGGKAGNGADRSRLL